MNPKRDIVPVAQIVLREREDGRVEVAVMHRGPESTPHLLARLIVASLGKVADVRELGAQLLEGRRVCVATLTILAEGEALELAPALPSPPLGAVNLFGSRQRVEA